MQCRQAGRHRREPFLPLLSLPLSASHHAARNGFQNVDGGQASPFRYRLPARPSDTPRFFKYQAVGRAVLIVLFQKKFSGRGEKKTSQRADLDRDGQRGRGQERESVESIC